MKMYSFKSKYAENNLHTRTHEYIKYSIIMKNTNNYMRTQTNFFFKTLHVHIRFEENKD